jgi:hypothetical protein
MRLTNPNDLSAVGKSFEGVTGQVKNYLKGLAPGTGLVLGKEYPIMVDIRTRRTKHGGQMKQVTETVEPEEDTEQEETVETGTEKIQVLPAQYSLEEVEEQLGKQLSRAYYPVWHVHGRDGEVFIDGVDGSVKAEKPGLPKTADDVLRFVAVKNRSVEDVEKRLDLDREALETALQTLHDHGLVTVAEEEGETVIGAEPTVFDKDPVTEKPDGKTITAKTGREAVEQQATQYVGSVETVDKLYYPYYAAENFVFDAVNGEEV